MVKSSMDQIARCRKGLIPPTHNEHRQQQNLKGIDEYEMDVEPVPEHARKAAQAAVARASRQAPSLVSGAGSVGFMVLKLSKVVPRRSDAQTAAEPPPKTFPGIDLDELADHPVVTLEMRRIQVGTFDCGACTLVFEKGSCQFFVAEGKVLPNGSSTADPVTLGFMNISRMDISKKRAVLIITGYFGIDQFGEHYEEYHAVMGAPAPARAPLICSAPPSRRSCAGPPGPPRVRVRVQVTQRRASCASSLAMPTLGRLESAAIPRSCATARTCERRRTLRRKTRTGSGSWSGTSGTPSP